MASTGSRITVSLRQKAQFGAGMTVSEGLELECAMRFFCIVTHHIRTSNKFPIKYEAAIAIAPQKPTRNAPRSKDAPPA